MPAVAAGKRQAIHVLRIDLTRPGIELEVTAPQPAKGRHYRAQTTSAFVARHRLQAAVNGGFFEPFAGGSFAGDDYYPREGDSVDVQEPREARRASLCVTKPARMRIERAGRCPPGTDLRMTAGPLLMKDGIVPADLRDKARHPRTAVGISADAATAWMVVVDGRQPLWSEGATLQELSEIFRRLGAADAINLDGGGSTTMVIWDASEPRVVNSPMHTAVPGRERPVANHLGVRAAAPR